ncbi:MAG: helix-turn-helix domain-containing protein [Candidatus Brocadiales bacterium]
MNKQAVGERLKGVILSQGITQKKFAEMVGFSDKYISDIVKGRTKPSLALLLQIQSVFNVSTEWLIAGAGVPPKKVLEDVIKESTPVYQLHPEKTLRLKEDKAEGPSRARVALPLLSEAQVLNMYNTNTYIRQVNAEEYCLFQMDWLSKPEETLCMQVSGPGMDPVLKEGSLVALNIGVRDPVRLVGSICGIRVVAGPPRAEGVEGIQASPERICFRWLRASEPYLVFAPQQEGHPLLCFPITENPIIGKVEGAWVRF